jgi:hypothetical protein
MIYQLLIPTDLFDASPEVQQAFDLIEKRLRAFRREQAAAKATAQAERTKAKEAAAADKEVAAVIRTKLKRSKGAFPHVDQCLTDDFIFAPGESITVNEFCLALVNPFPAGKAPDCLLSLPAIEAALLPNHPIVDGRVMNLRPSKVKVKATACGPKMGRRAGIRMGRLKK